MKTHTRSPGMNGDQENRNFLRRKTNGKYIAGKYILDLYEDRESSSNIRDRTTTEAEVCAYKLGLMRLVMRCRCA